MTDMSEPHRLREYSLQDKYSNTVGGAYLTGIQALVRLPIAQKRRDAKAGLKTAGFVTGYRGSPLGTYDEQLAAARNDLQAHDILITPAINEDLAATAVWGSQQAETAGEGRYDGVFSIWYGKGPGVDRSGDALRHGNLAGSSKYGGVLVLVGDDHTCESSTTCHQSEFALVDAQIPILSPAGVAELVEYGIVGWSMSRYSGCWVGLKCMKDTVESSASVVLDEEQIRIVTPIDHPIPSDGLNIRQPDSPHAQEFRLVNYKHDAVRAFTRANRLDRVVFGKRDGARIGIVASGKTWLDVRQALEDLGIDEDRARAIGVAVFKVAVVWPLEPLAIGEFALGLEVLVVVEEKRSLIEAQVKEILYGDPRAPKIIGKKDEGGNKFFPIEMALDASLIARAIGRYLAPADPSVGAALEALAKRKPVLPDVEAMTRSFYFCAGCPHNTSTHVPEDSKAYAGIGCSWMAQSMDRKTTGYTQMGAEGMSWVGEAPFSRRTHMFQNMGDGTYFHSGSLAVRAAVAAKANITFKILFNDAVAMTGGQRHDGTLNPSRISWQMYAEGVSRIAVVADDPKKYPADTSWAPAVSIHARDELDRVQRELRDIPGTSVLIYDQTCAAVKRRRRKRGDYPDPHERLLINREVCEGCGDCGVESNCVAIIPVETEFGRKREIDQAACNKDFSCAKGFCPSFVTVKGGTLRRSRDDRVLDGDFKLPEPLQPDLQRGTYSVVIAGIGGSGIVTVGALLGTAAHLEDKGVGVLDMAGLAQKGGSVWSHVRFAARPAQVTSARVPPAGADLILGCDLVVAASAKTLALTCPGRTKAIVNTQQTFTGEFTRNPDLVYPIHPLIANVLRGVGESDLELLDAGALATRLCGDPVATNLFMLGVAAQRGLLPVGVRSIERAIELNGAAVTANVSAFRWGRTYGAHPQIVAAAMKPPAIPSAAPASLARRVEFLTEYQNAAYAARYLTLVEIATAAEARLSPGSTDFGTAVAASLFKLMAYKDEYEVARLFRSSAFENQLRSTFDGEVSLRFHLAPPIWEKLASRAGRRRKIEFGPWVLTAFHILARLKFLRGTWLDPFGLLSERRLERKLIKRFEATIIQLVTCAEPEDHGELVLFAKAPLQIRGFGHIKAAAIERYEREVQAMMRRWNARSRARSLPPVAQVSTQV